MKHGEAEGRDANLEVDKLSRHLMFILPGGRGLSASVSGDRNGGGQKGLPARGARPVVWSVPPPQSTCDGEARAAR